MFLLKLRKQTLQTFHSVNHVDGVQIEALSFGRFLSSVLPWRCRHCNIGMSVLLTAVICWPQLLLWPLTSDPDISSYILTFAVVIFKINTISPHTTSHCRFPNSCLNFISEISQHPTDIQGVHCMVSQGMEALALSKLGTARNLEHLVTLLSNKGRGRTDYKFAEDGSFLCVSWHTTKWRITLGEPRAH